MIITSKLKMDLMKPGTTPTIHAVQNDSYSRNLEITLLSDRNAFVFPEDGAVVIRYKKSDGKGGEYDTLPDGSAAWWAEGNTLTVALAPQVLTTPGSVLLTVSLIAGGTQLSIFPIRLSVEPVAAAKLARSEDYFYITGLLPAPAFGKAGQYLRIAAVNDKGRITSVEAADCMYEDKEAIIQDVITALGTPVFGTVDEENNIILTGTLADGVYTLKYEHADGQVTAIGTLEHMSGTQSYTNQLPLSIGSDGSPYQGGQGWKAGYRLNSSGGETASDIHVITGFIPAKYGDILRMVNGIFCTSTGTNYYIALYDSSFTHLGYHKTINTDFNANLVKGVSITEDMTSYGISEQKFTGDIAQTAYIRMSCHSISSDTIVTINEEIPT